MQVQRFQRHFSSNWNSLLSLKFLSAQTRYLLASRTKLVVAGVGLSFLIMLSWGQNLITAADQEKLAATGSLFAALTTVPLLLIVVSLGSA